MHILTKNLLQYTFFLLSTLSYLQLNASESLGDDGMACSAGTTCSHVTRPSGKVIPSCINAMRTRIAPQTIK